MTIIEIIRNPGNHTPEQIQAARDGYAQLSDKDQRSMDNEIKEVIQVRKFEAKLMMLCGQAAYGMLNPVSCT